LIRPRLISLMLMALALSVAGVAAAQEEEPPATGGEPAEESGPETSSEAAEGETEPATEPEGAGEDLAAPEGEPVPEEPALPSCEDAKNAKECKAICVEKFREEKDRKRQEKAERDALKDAEELPAHGWVTIGTGVALLVAGGVTGGLALKTNGQLEKDCPNGTCMPEHYDDIDKRDNLALTSTVLLSAGIGVTAVGILVLAVFSRGPVAIDDDSDVSLVPSAGAGVAAATLKWRF